MFDMFLESYISYIRFASYVPPFAGKKHHVDRVSHGLVLNDPDVVRDYIFDDGRVLHTKGNTLFYLPKGSTYRVQRIDGHGGCYAINFDLSVAVSAPPFMLTLRSADSVRRSFKEADRAQRMQSKTALTVTQRALCDIILAGYEEQQRTYVPDRRAAQIAPAMEAIASDFCKNELRVPMLAELCGMSEVYFRRIFHDLHGKSPKDYIADMRITRACQLLSDGGFSILAISKLCGYSEPTHFSREFKRRVGVCPADYKYGK